MARKSSARRGPQGQPQASGGGAPPAGYPHQGPARTATPAGPPRDPADRRPGAAGQAGQPEQEGGPLTRFRRAGAGGRWWVWVGRAVLWAFIVIVAVNGIRAPFVQTGESSQPTTPTRTDQTAFPTSQVSAYAVQFAHAYLNYDRSAPQARSRRLAQFLPEDVDPQLGWSGTGASELQSVHVVDVRVKNDRNAVVMLSVLVNNQRMRLAVPVHAKDGAVVISGQPALMAPPPKAKLPSQPSGEVDAAATQQLSSQLPDFFKAYARGSASLSRFLADGASVRGLDGAVQFVRLRNATVPTGGKVRQMTATVVWQLPSTGQTAARGGRLEQSYQLTVVKQNGDWYIKAVHGSATLPSGQ